MKPVYWMLAVVLGAGGVGAWQWLQRGEPAVASAPVSSAPANPPLPVAAPAPSPSASPSPPRPEQWVADLDSADAGIRQAAITALAEAPRDIGLPALKRMSLHGDPALEKPLALTSLVALAKAQGDGDGAIRAVFREVMYHGEDAELTASAQAALDAVEAQQRP